MKPSTQYTIPLAKKSMVLSCAECRRLKLKCTRVFPCTNCVKKGCEAIWVCSLTTGKGNRFVLANTELLHEKINILAKRARHLEDALEESHSNFSNEPHHLLSSELLKIKKPLERGAENGQWSSSGNSGLTPDIGLDNRDPAETNEVIDAVGSLCIAQPDRMTYHGSSANAFYLLTIEGSDEGEEDEGNDVSLPDSIPWLSHSFPLDINHVSNVLRGDLLSCLPEPAEAQELSDVYFQHAGWMYTPILEPEYKDEIFSLFYDHNMPSRQDSLTLASHKLALLFFVFALGKLLDPGCPTIQVQAAMKYYHIGKAALNTSSFLEARSIPALQALVVMCHFMLLANIESSRWIAMGLIVQLTQTIGLHRDGAKFSLSPAETLHRRSLMWEVYTFESWQSLTFGRPNSFALSSIDCEMAHETTHNEFGDVDMSFAAWKHRFSSQCLSIVHNYAFGARTPNYKIIQELDKKVRGYYIPPSLQVPGFGGKTSALPLVINGGEMERPSLQLTMQRYIAFAIKEMTLFYMHRGYFARSTEDNKDDPLGGKYGPSVLAVHRSACSFINLVQSLHSQHPGMAERMWFLFNHVFSCSVVLGSVTIKFPGLPLSHSAFSSLETSCVLFASVSHHNRAMKVLPILRRLRERASESISHYQSGKVLSSRLSQENSDVQYDTEELVCGKTRLVPRRSFLTQSSRSRSESLSGSSPQEKPRGHITIPPDSVKMPGATPSDFNGSLDSPMTEQHDSWEHNISPQTSNSQHEKLHLAIPNNTYGEYPPVHWPNSLQSFPNHYQQHPPLISPNDQQQTMLAMTGSSPSSWDMLGLAETSLDGGTMFYSQQPQLPPSPPTNDAHADWQYFLAQTLQD